MAQGHRHAIPRQAGLVIKNLNYIHAHEIARKREILFLSCVTALPLFVLFRLLYILLNAEVVEKHEDIK